MGELKNAKTLNINVVIVDDDSFISSSLSTILNANEDIEVSALGFDGNEAIRLYQQHKPDILLIDIQMPNKNGLTAAAEILTQYPDARIVFLTTFSDDEYIIAALHMGAKGYLIKQEVANIAPALRSVMMGQNVLGDEVFERFDTLMHPQDASSNQAEHDSSSRKKGYDLLRKQGLSDRELEVLELIAEGLDNKEVASQAYMSEGTVRNHVSTILSKLGLKNRTQLAVFYYRNL